MSYFNFVMRAYIYIISFKNKNDIYIGKTTKNIKERFSSHKSSGTVHQYVKETYDNDWSDVSIDIVDSVSMDEDLTYILNNPFNNIEKNGWRTYTWCLKTNKDLLKYRLDNLEQFHMNNFKHKYNLVNKRISSDYKVYETYELFNYNRVIKKN